VVSLLIALLAVSQTQSVSGPGSHQPMRHGVVFWQPNSAEEVGPCPPPGATRRMWPRWTPAPSSSPRSPDWAPRRCGRFAPCLKRSPLSVRLFVVGE